MKTLVDKQRAFFQTNQTKNTVFRIAQLKKLRQLIHSNEERFHQAIYEDFGKSAFDNYTCELALLYTEIDEAIRKVKKWSAPKKVSTNWINFPGKSYVIPEPFGVSLVIGAWNYPYQLSLGPAIAAMAAGNTVVLKPSELPIRTSHLMAELIHQTFDEAYFKVVEGGVPETELLLQQRFDKIFFTGSVPVGRIVYQAAARHLTPVTLELGGKSPALILDDKTLPMYVKRLVWAKFLNAGQTCIAPDYVLISRELKDRFIQLTIEEIKKEKFSLENDNYVRIINSRNIDRLSRLIDGSPVVHGGNIDKEQRLIEPTLLCPVTPADPVMKEEIFGPVLPILTFETVDEAIRLIKNGEKPLSCYLFTQDSALKKKLLHELSFGGGCVNDAVMHISNPKLPFGGVGESGMGAYHGKHGFKCFSHFKSVLEKPVWFEASLKYYPHTPFRLNIMKKLFNLH